MRSPGKYVVLCCLIAASTPSLAQVCREPGAPPSGIANLTCDMNYRNQVLTCDPKNPNAVLGTHPACPPKPMPMLDTPNTSYIGKYSPTLFAPPRDPEDPTRPYSGNYSIGTKGDTNEVLQMFGAPPKGVSSVGACKVLLEGAGAIDKADILSQARFNRLQMDSCANEYILNWALNPFKDEIPSKLSGEDPSNPAALADLETSCQPIATTTINDDEYLPSDYLKAAWMKLLVDPSYRKSAPSKHEPHLPEGVKITNPVNPPDPFPEIRISQLGAVPYEKISDPTHPFSPRWDFILNDRQYSMPSSDWGSAPNTGRILANYAIMRTYMLWPENAVFCAGVRSENKLLKLAEIGEKLSKMDMSDITNLDLANITDKITAKGSALFDKFGLNGDGMKILTDLKLDSKLMGALEKMKLGDFDAFAKLPDASKALFEKLQNGIDFSALEKMPADMIAKLTDTEKGLLAAVQKMGGEDGILKNINANGISDMFAKATGNLSLTGINDQLLTLTEKLQNGNVQEMFQKAANINGETFAKLPGTLQTSFTEWQGKIGGLNLSGIDPSKLDLSGAGNQLVNTLRSVGSDPSKLLNTNINSLVTNLNPGDLKTLGKLGVDTSLLTKTVQIQGSGEIMNYLNTAKSGVDALVNAQPGDIKNTVLQFKDQVGKLTAGGGVLSAADTQVLQSFQRVANFQGVPDMIDPKAVKAMLTQEAPMSLKTVMDITKKATELNIPDEAFTGATQVAGALNGKVDVGAFAESAGATLTQIKTKLGGGDANLSKLAEITSDMPDVLGDEASFKGFADNYSAIKSSVENAAGGMKQFAGFYQDVKTFSEGNSLDKLKLTLETAKNLGFTPETTKDALGTLTDKLELSGGNPLKALDFDVKTDGAAMKLYTSLGGDLMSGGGIGGGAGGTGGAMDVANIFKSTKSLSNLMDSRGAVATIKGFSDIESVVKGGLSLPNLDKTMSTVVNVNLKGTGLGDLEKSIGSVKQLVDGGLNFKNVTATLSGSGVLLKAGFSLDKVGNVSKAFQALGGKGVDIKQLASVDKFLNKAGRGGALNLLKSKSGKSNPKTPVDVMEFRRDAFEEAIFARNNYNALCFADSFVPEMPPMVGPPAVALVAATSVCFQWGPLPPPAFAWAQRRSCWECFGNKPMRMIKDDSKAPCTMNYLGQDKKMDLKMPAIEGAADAVMALALPFAPAGKIAKKIFKRLLNKAVKKIAFGLPTIAPGALNYFNPQAQCNAGNGIPLPRNSKYNMDKVCEDLRKPVTMINRLKMRYSNPDDPSSDALPEGVPEGMRFKDYFGDHMPYPRLWDTGAPLQKTPGGGGVSQPPLDTTGQFTAIVGVGREASPKVAASAAPPLVGGKNPADVYTDQRCKTMGWGSKKDLSTSALSAVESVTGLDAKKTLDFAGFKVKVPDPLTSWAELKLYQANTSRTAQMNCLGRYEKIFKPYSAENMILKAAGADWTHVIVAKCPRGANAGAAAASGADPCTYLSLREYVAAGTPKTDANYSYKIGNKKDPIPNTWRGYMASTLDGGKHKFPDFASGSNAPGGIGGVGALSSLFGGGTSGGNSAAKLKGLDKAKPGDVLMMPYGPGNNKDKPGLAKVSLVVEVNNSDCDDIKNCYVKVLEPDNGKFPDVCGTTDTSGQMKARYYYKADSLPPAAAEEYKRIGLPGNSCEETSISHCELSAWDDLILYRIQKDRRKPCDKASANDC